MLVFESARDARLDRPCPRFKRQANSRADTLKKLKTGSRMKLVNSLCTFLAVGLGLCLATQTAQAASPPPELPDASTVMERVVKRAELDDRADPATSYTYEKHAVAQELDSAGNPQKTTEETYQVFPIGGVAYSRLIRIQNRDLTEKELKEENRKEEEFRKSLNRPSAGQDASTNHGWLDPSLVGRFVFHTEGRETVDHRSMLVLSFHPKPTGTREKTVADRVLSRLAGTLWVDEQDWEIARVKVKLTADLSLGWFGMVGSIKKLDMELTQTRLADGVWIGQKQTVALRGRKLFSSMGYRTVEESSKFRKL